MNWEAVGAIGEIVGAAGVVATLGYLAVQIQRSAKSTNTAAFQETVRSAQDLSSLVAQDGELARLLVAGSQNRGELSTEDRLRFHSFWTAMFTILEMSFHYRKNGMLESEVFESQSHDLVTYLQNPGVLSSDHPVPDDRATHRFHYCSSSVQRYPSFMTRLLSRQSSEKPDMLPSSRRWADRCREGGLLQRPVS